jgi:hypothetical protein
VRLSCAFVDFTRDKYELLVDICLIPDKFLHGNLSASTVTLSDTTRAVCSSLCSNVYSVDCSGFLFDRSSQSCTISAYTGEWYESSNPCRGTNSRVEFYRRHRHVGKTGHFTTVRRLTFRLVSTSFTSDSPKINTRVDRLNAAAVVSTGPFPSFQLLIVSGCKHCDSVTE